MDSFVSDWHKTYGEFGRKEKISFTWHKMNCFLFLFSGTGASPTTLQTLRLKIEERQRLKAQALRHDIMLQSHHASNNSNIKGKNSKFMKKFKK